MAERKVLIVGAGIGGLALAIELRAAGVLTEVYEASNDLRKMQVGGGLFLWNNGRRALQQLGVEDQIRAVCSKTIADFELRSWRDKPLMIWPVGEVEATVGAPAGGIGRADLMRILIEAADESSVRLNMRCTGFTQDAEGVTAHFADGSVAHGDVLIGADGANSIVRTQISNKVKPTYTGYTLWHTIVDFDHRVTSSAMFLEYWGVGARFVCYPTAPRQMYWSAVANAPEGGSDPPTGLQDWLLDYYRGWPEPVEAAIRAAPEKSIKRKDIYGCDPIPLWGTGRVTILGDAAHPMTFNLGQGACKSLEDALVLARCLAAPGDAVAALRSYEAQRIARATDIMKRARSIGNSGRMTNPIAVKTREIGMRLLSTRSFQQHRRDMAYAF